MQPMNKLITTLLTFFFSAAMVHAQILMPARDQQEPITLFNGTLHIGNGTVIEQGLVHFDKGRIVYAGKMDDEARRKYLKNEFRSVDATGKHIYPGLIALNTILGLNEIDAVRATRDYHEIGHLNMNVRSIVAYNPESVIIPTVKFNGVLMAEIKPDGGRISGTGSLVQLDAWNWQDAAVATDVTMHLNWPASSYSTGWWAEPGETVSQHWDAEMLELRKVFEEAKAYAALKKPETVHLKYEAMRGLFNGSCKLMIHADDRIAITSALAFATDYGIKPVIVGGADAWMVTAELRKAGASVVITRTHRLPGRQDDPIDLVYRLPKVLKDSGVLFSITDVNSWQQRNVAFQAGNAVAYGLSKEEALASVTLNPAKMLGVDKSCGSLEAGKDATLIIAEGDLLDMKSNVISEAFIQGREIPMLNGQRMQYDKYRTKFGL
jgi:imidazolonepropionase-like amidohydrolase